MRVELKDMTALRADWLKAKNEAEQKENILVQERIKQANSFKIKVCCDGMGRYTTRDRNAIGEGWTVIYFDGEEVNIGGAHSSIILGNIKFCSFCGKKIELEKK